MTGYSVIAADRGGEFIDRHAADFPAALAEYRALRAKYSTRDVCVLVFNLDRTDGEWNGLTEDERDAIETADMDRAALKQAGAP